MAPAHARQREPEGRSPAQRAAKATRSVCRDREDYGWGWAGGVTKTDADTGTSQFRLGYRLSLDWVWGRTGVRPQTQSKESLMQKMNVYDRARNLVRELVPLLHTIRDHDKSLADQLKRAAQSVVLNIAEARGNDAGNARARFSTACGSAKEVRAALNVASDWGYIEAHMATHLDAKLDEVCAITWCLSRRL